MQTSAIIRLVHRCIEESPKVHRIESDVATLKSDVATLKSDVGTLKSESSRLGILMEALQADQRTIMDVVIDLSRRFDEAIRARDSVHWSAHRLDAVEDGLKRHIKNRKAHRTTEA